MKSLYEVFLSENFFTKFSPGEIGVTAYVKKKKKSSLIEVPSKRFLILGNWKNYLSASLVQKS